MAADPPQLPNAGTPAPKTVLIEKGEDPSVLVMAFSGFQSGMTMPMFDFFAATRLSRYSRILLRDTSRTCYVSGVPPLAEGYDSLLEYLRQNIAELAPKQILCIGASSGAFGALLFGHALGADYVHAFSPYSFIGRTQIVKHGDEDSLARHGETLDRIDALPPEVHRLFDLQPILARDNGKTSRYYVHVCANSRWDLMRARRLEKCPNVLIIGYPCEGHGVASTLAKNDLLGDLLKIENQPELGRRLRERLQR
jgi:hypothetical protein